MERDHRLPPPAGYKRIGRIYEQSTERDVGARLKQILGRHNPWKLPDTVDAEDREDAIVAAVKRGHRAVIVGYRRVSEGFNLQIIDSIIWLFRPLSRSCCPVKPVDRQQRQIQREQLLEQAMQCRLVSDHSGQGCLAIGLVVNL
jgi:hypothetical protein